MHVLYINIDAFQLKIQRPNLRKRCKWAVQNCLRLIAVLTAFILREWVEETDVDGFNLAYAVTPQSFEDLVGYIVPELQGRGAYPTVYRDIVAVKRSDAESREKADIRVVRNN
jgi:hypothetical protein